MSFATNVLSRGLATTAWRMAALNHITVIGGGSMGSGIAQVSAQAGYKVTMVDQNDEILNKSCAIINKSLQRVVKKKFADDPSKGEAYISDIMSKISTTTDSSKAVSNTDLVIEAIIENMGIKKKLFSELDKVAKESTIFASNTSSLSISEMAKVTKRPEKFGGLHFFNPVPMMKLVEVVRTSNTNDNTFDTLFDYCKKLGKVPVNCKDTPGFIVNRLLVPYMMEAVRMVERGDASPKDIDTGMKLGAGYPMGPIELADYVGLDVCKFILDGDSTPEDVDVGMKLGAGYPMGPFELGDYVGLDITKFIIDGWHEEFPDHPLFVPSPLLNKFVDEGKLGRKTGEGFYKY